MTAASTPPSVHRVGPRRIVAVVVAALMLVGIAALVAVAVWGDDAPAGHGLQPPVNVERPATAEADRDTTAGTGSHGEADEADETVDADEADDVPAPVPVPPGGDGDDVDLDLDGSTPLESTAPAESVAPSSSDAALPQPSEPVQLPAIVAPPGPTTTVVISAIGSLEPAAVAGLEGWEVAAREPGYLQLTHGSRVIELFVLDGRIATADGALAHFFADLGDELQDLAESPMTRLRAPNPRYVSVAGAQFSAVTASQQGTRTITGSAVAAVDGDHVALVATATREGAASVEQLRADAELLNALLARATA